MEILHWLPLSAEFWPYETRMWLFRGMISDHLGSPMSKNWKSSPLLLLCDLVQVPLVWLLSGI